MTVPEGNWWAGSSPRRHMPHAPRGLIPDAVLLGVGRQFHAHRIIHHRAIVKYPTLVDGRRVSINTLKGYTACAPLWASLHRPKRLALGRFTPPRRRQ